MVKRIKDKRLCREQLKGKCLFRQDGLLKFMIAICSMPIQVFNHNDAKECVSEKGEFVRRATNVFQTFLVSGVFSLLVLAFLLGFSGGAQADALTWQTLAPMPTARYGAATGAIGGKLYVAGGWTSQAPMPTGATPFQ
jgi:Kelch motif